MQKITTITLIIHILLTICNSLPISAQVFINEIMASNASIIADPDNGEYADWVELYNASNQDIDISGWFLSDNISDTTKWQLPAGTTINAFGFLLLWCDGLNNNLHTNFKLSSIGEEIALYNSNKTLLDSFTFNEQYTNISYGKKFDGSTAALRWFTKPSPNASNNNTFAYTGFVKYEPIFKQPGGFYTNPQTLQIENVAGVGLVRYTLNGANPDNNSPIYTDPIPLLETTVVKASVFLDSLIPGPIITNTYFINEQLNSRGLAVMSLSTHPNYIWNADSGLYVQNFKPDWEYPVHLEFYEPNGLLGFHHDAGVKVDGENSWELPQKMLSIYSRKKYSGNKILYQVFPNDARTQYENIILRCSGNDWSNTLFRDGMQQHISTLNMDSTAIQHFRPCIVYINGKYMGIHNIRTRGDEEYLAQKYHVNPNNLDIIENEGSVNIGDNIAYNKMIGIIQNGVAADSNFAKLSKIMNIQDYTDYIQTELFCANTSWGHNIACWRERSDTARFRWLWLDFDRGFFMNNVNDVAMNFFTDTNGNSWSNPAWATLPLRQMLKNQAYKNYFINRFADHLYTTFNPLRLYKHISSYAKNIRPEIPFHVNRWLGATSNYGDAIPSIAYWENEVSKLNQFANTRNTFVFDDLNTYFNLNGTSPLNLYIEPNNGGGIMINNNQVPLFPFSGNYFNNRTFTLKAVPKVGFKFLHWSTIETNLDTIIAFNTTWKYYDNAVAPNNNWFTSNFDDVTWQTANGEFGYGDNDETTLLNYGNNANNKTISYYFRNTFNISDTNSITQPLTLHLIADDGAVVYLNGIEAARYNMPTGNITATTLANQTVGSPEENTPQLLTLSPTLLKNGSNVIAIEIHQAAANSSDISFNAQLSTITAGNETEYATQNSIEITLNNNPLSFKAIYSPTACTLPDTIFSNLTLTADCSPYYAQNTVTIKPNLTLNVMPGVTILMPPYANLIVEGAINVQGTAEQPVNITLNNNIGNTNWGGILLHHTTDTCNFNYLNLSKANGGIYNATDRGAIAGYYAQININNTTIDSVNINPIFTRFSSTQLKNSKIHCTVTGDGINVKQGYAYTENCEFWGDKNVDTDGIDYDGVANGVIKQCKVHDFRGDNNDGLDIGENCNNLLIENNLIYNCVDKGISVGQTSAATIQNNTIANCAMGVGLKDLSPVTLLQNTFYGNQSAIRAYEKNPGYKGGIGTVSNCIFSNSSGAAIFADSTAVLNISYSLSDTDTLNNTLNITDNPLFVDAPFFDFELNNNSPCIGSGANGNNMGALVHFYTGNTNIVISEFLYYDTTNLQKEFIELYNPSNQIVDVSGYAISGAISFTIPFGTIMMPGEYLLICENADVFANLNNQKFTWTNGKLANEGEKIQLTDAAGIVQDFVNYGVTSPWADSSQVKNKSLELKSSHLDNHFANSWQISAYVGGSPGTDPLTTGLSTPVAVNNTFSKIFPNPASNYIIIQNNTIKGATVSIFNAFGQMVFNNTLKAANTIINTNNWANGVYFINLNNGKQTQKQLLIINH